VEMVWVCVRVSRVTGAAMAGRVVVELSRVSCLETVPEVRRLSGRRAPASEGAAGFSRLKVIAVRTDMLMGFGFILRFGCWLAMETLVLLKRSENWCGDGLCQQNGLRNDETGLSFTLRGYQAIQL
jgi:hypothetical protein